MWNEIGRQKNNILKKRTGDVQMFRAIIVMRTCPGCNQMTFPMTTRIKLWNQFTSQTWFATLMSSRLFSGSNIDQTQEQQKSSLFCTGHQRNTPCCFCPLFGIFHRKFGKSLFYFVVQSAELYCNIFYFRVQIKPEPHPAWSPSVV